MSVQFREITKADLEGERLTALNNLIREMCEEINRLGGDFGAISLNSGLNMRGNKITNLGSGSDDGDAVNHSQI